MVRTQISLTEDQMTRAREEARRRGVSVAALVREALDHMLGGAGDEQVCERAKAAVGGFRSGERHISEHHDQALAAAGRW